MVIKWNKSFGRNLFSRYRSAIRLVGLISCLAKSTKREESLREVSSKRDQRQSKARQWNCDYRPSRVACPHQTPIYEGESNGMEYDERQGEVSTKERENGRVRSGTGIGWRSKIELERNGREVLGAVCWILEINTTYPISLSLVILRTIARVTHVYVHNPNITLRKMRGEMLRRLIPDFLWNCSPIFVFIKELWFVHYLYLCFFSGNDSISRINKKI